VKQTKVFPPSKVNLAAVPEMLHSEDKSFLSQDHARSGFFCPRQSSMLSQWAMYFQTHHMFWCHILHSLSSMLCTHHSALTDCMTVLLLFQVFKLKQLKKNLRIMSNGHKDTAWGCGTGLQATVLPVQPRRLFTAWPGAQGWLAI